MRCRRWSWLAVAAVLGAAGDARADDPNAPAITAVIDGVINALNTQNGVALSSFYANGSGTGVFYGLIPEARNVQGAGPYTTELGTCLASFISVDVQRSTVNIESSGGLAVASLRGSNTVETVEGQATSPWRWTLEFEEVAPGQWRITHEHVSFDRGGGIVIADVPTTSWRMLIGLALALILVSVLWRLRRRGPVPA